MDDMDDMVNILFHMRQWLSDRLCWDAVTILQGGVTMQMEPRMDM